MSLPPTHSGAPIDPSPSLERVRRDLLDFHGRQDIEGLLTYAKVVPASLISSHYCSRFGNIAWEQWVCHNLVENRIGKDWDSQEKSKDRLGFIRWLKEDHPSWLPTENWFAIRELTKDNAFSSLLDEELVVLLLGRLQPTDRKALVTHPSFWSSDAKDDPIIRAAWETLAESDKLAALPTMIKHAARGNRLELLDAWDNVATQYKQTLDNRSYAVAVYEAAMAQSHASVRKIMGTHHPDISGFLHEWVTDNREDLADHFMVAYLQGDELNTTLKALTDYNPGVSYPRTTAATLAASRAARGTGNIASAPHRSRVRP